MQRLRWIAMLTLGLATASSAFSACKIAQIAEIPVRVVGNRVLVDAQINGQNATVMVDTGASMTFLWQDEAARLGLPVESITGLRLFGVGGEARALGTVVKKFQMGSFSGDQLRLAVVGTKEGRQRREGALVLGDDFFSHFTTEFDLAHNVIRLLRPESCQPGQLIYWGGKSYSLAALEPVILGHERIQTPVRVDGKRARAILDTGASTSVVAQQTAADVGVNPAAAVPTQAVVGLAFKPLESWIGTFATFSIGDEEMSNVKLRIADLFTADTTQKIGSRISRPLEDTPDMLVGCDFFLSHRILVLAKERMLLFTYNGGPVFQFVTSSAPAQPSAPAPATTP